MKKRTFWLIGIISACTFLATQSCYYDNFREIHPDAGLTPCDSTKVISFSNNIAPMLNNSCGSGNSCHNASSANNFTTYNSVLTYVQNGKLLSSVTWDGNASNMPQGSSSQISACEIGTIRSWINAGAPNN